LVDKKGILSLSVQYFAKVHLWGLSHLRKPDYLKKNQNYYCSNGSSSSISMKVDVVCFQQRMLC